MRDETYGISIIGLAAGLYGMVALIGLVHATVAPSLASVASAVDNEENVTIVAKR